MINLLKGEFYKLFRSRAFYVSAAVSVFFVIFMYGMLVTADKVQSGQMDNGTGGVVVENGQENEPPILEQLGNLDVLQQLYANCNRFLIVVFASIFVIGEYTNGAVKNVVGKGYTRWQIFLSKFISVSAATIIFMLITTAASLIAGRMVLVNQTYDHAFFTDLFTYLGIQTLLSVGICGMSMLVAEVCRSLGAGITINFLIATFSSLVMTGLDLLVRLAAPGTDFSFSDYWLFGMQENCPMAGVSADVPVRIIVVGLVWLVLCAGLGLWHFKKADIK